MMQLKLHVYASSCNVMIKFINRANYFCCDHSYVLIPYDETNIPFRNAVSRLQFTLP